MFGLQIVATVIMNQLNLTYHSNQIMPCRKEKLQKCVALPPKADKTSTAHG
jgi:hypothetical protein